MAAPADITAYRATETSLITEGELYNLRTQFNTLVAQLRVLTAKLDADAGVTDTNYAALVTDSGVGPAKVVLGVG